MGLFSFIKNAGAKVFGIGKTTAEEAAEAAAEKAGKLMNAVEALGLKVENLSIRVDDDTATIYGEAEDQAAGYGRASHEMAPWCWLVLV